MFKKLLIVPMLVLALQQTPTQIVDQISGLLAQLKGMLSTTTTTTTNVGNAAALNSALSAGGSITLATGTYVGNFVIDKPTILTGSGVTLVPFDKFQPTLTVTSSDVTVKGITVQNGAPDRETFVIGSNSATSVATQPQRVLVENVSVLAGSTGGHRGFSLHGVDITLKNVTVKGFYEEGRDAQAVWINNGPGPYKILNSFLEASGENILIGGADPGIVGVVPSDITITGNTLYKPDNFVTLGTVKNSFEVKNGQRVLFENNLIDGNWLDGQGGSPIVLTVRNQDSTCTWCIVNDITIRGNKTNRTPDGFAVNILGSDNAYPSLQTKRITIEYNLFLGNYSGFQIGNGVSESLIIRHNTLPQLRGTFLLSYDTRSVPVRTPLTFTDNVVKQGEYGINGNLLNYAAFTGNIVEVHPDRTVALPAGNIQVAPGSFLTMLDKLTFKLINGTAGY